MWKLQRNDLVNLKKPGVLPLGFSLFRKITTNIATSCSLPKINGIHCYQRILEGWDYNSSAINCCRYIKVYNIIFSSIWSFFCTLLQILENWLWKVFCLKTPTNFIWTCGPMFIELRLVCFTYSSQISYIYLRSSFINWNQWPTDHPRNRYKDSSSCFFFFSPSRIKESS